MEFKEKNQMEIKQDIHNYLEKDESHLFTSQLISLIPDITFYKEMKDYEQQIDRQLK